MNLESFRALRLGALIIAADREYRGSTEPIPEMPAVPGISGRHPSRNRSAPAPRGSR